jgi:hypothetical protein
MCWLVKFSDWVMMFCLCGNVWVGSLQWVLVYCGSSTYNDIKCLVGFFYYTFHLLVIFLSLSTWSSEALEIEACTNKTSKCYYHHRHLKVMSKLKKRRPHSNFLPTLCLLLSHLVHSNEDPDDQGRWILKILHTGDKRRWPPTYLNSNILVYIPSPCFFFLRISERDSV